MCHFSFHIIDAFLDEMGSESQRIFKLYVFQFYLREKERNEDREGKGEGQREGK